MKHGGKRPGAGRKTGTRLVVTKAEAGELLDRLDQDAYWKRYLDSKDENVSLKAMIYLTNRKKGMPAQSVVNGDKPFEINVNIRRVGN